jgi:hypothetical protein
VEEVMNVTELIEYLSDMDGEREVLISVTDDFGTYCEPLDISQLVMGDGPDEHSLTVTW